MNEERRKVILGIVAQFESEDFRDTWMTESIGGSAGSNKAAINSFVDKETGEIIIFGNIQYTPDHVRYNPCFTEVTFLYDLGNSFLIYMSIINNQTLPVSPVSQRISMVCGGERGNISLLARANLRIAIRIVNYRLAVRLQEEVDKLRREI